MAPKLDKRRKPPHHKAVFKQRRKERAHTSLALQHNEGEPTQYKK
jgi:hypothetical protein